MICTTNLELANRTAELTRQQRRSQCQATDSMFGLLMLFQWVAAVWAACYVTPKAWVGEAVLLPHQHLWTAVIWGATISGIPLLLTIKYPGAATTRHVVAISQMLFSGLLIYLTGGRPETHFHVFGSLAFLAFYRDWRVLVTASLVITADHFFSGIYSTQSILESGGDGAFRCLEYSGWIVFENVFLVISCRREIRETWKSCERQARLENANQTMEAKVAARTDQLLKKTEEAEQLALVAQYTDNAVVITNALAQIQWVNEGFIRTSGYSLDEVRGKSPGSFLQGPNTDINTIQYMRQQLSRGEGFEVEIVNYNKQQQPYWVVIECRPIYNEHGDVTRFIAIESDITDRKKREEQLRLYSKAFTEANDAIIISEVPAGGGMAKILSVNAAFERMTGYTNAEVVGRNPRMLQGAGTDPAARARIRDSLKRWAPVREEMLNYKKNGEEFWVELNIAPLANEAGQFTHWVSVQRNITERKQLERNVVERTLELENAKEKAETANKLKSEFLANMSHEIRTPLNGVMGMLELLIGTELTDKQRGYAEISHNSANTLLALINDILDYSKIEAEQLTLESTPFNLRKMAEEITAIAATQAAVRSVEVILDYPSSTPSGVVGDPLRLRQVITNLLGNAIKFTESGYIVVEINAVLTEQNEHCFRIAVRDTGVGIPEEKQQYIFGKFAQADGSTTRKYGGTGLGLAISQHLVRLMGGRIHLNSEVGHGSEFAFHVSMPEADVSESEVFPMASLSQARLLVVDDLKINRLILMEQLQGKVQHIEAVDSGQKALEKLRKAAAAGSPYNIAIIDQQMPEMCGETLAFKISTSNEIPTLGMILLSSNGTDGIPADVGFSERLVKPTAHRVLLKVIGTVLAKVNRTSALPKSVDNVEPAFQSLRKVLLADDNVINQLVGKEALERLGCDVTVVENGKTALNALQSDSFEMIFMDCQMPVMDGYEATRLLRSHENASNRIPVIALTANALAGDRENCMAAGMDDYLPKPFGLTELQEIINKWGRPVS